MGQRAFGGSVLVLNGFPGTGKHTILKRLLALLPASTRLVDNHLLIDPASAILPDRSEAHHILRRRIRDAVFPSIRELVLKGSVVLMTACLAAGSERDAEVFQEHLALVQGTDAPLYWVNAVCEWERLVERAQSDARVLQGKTKLTDPAVLAELVSKHRLLEPAKLGLDGESTNLVVGSLDTNGEVDESVRRLVEMVGLVKAEGAE